jgi:hypothetical protein
VEKEFDRLKLNGTSLGEAHLVRFYDNLATAAKMVAGPGRIEQMLDEMKRGTRTLFKGP